jgi:MFS family permease
MEVVSGVGDGVFWVGLVAILFDLGAGASGFAAAVVVRLGPRALLGAPSGALIDRIDRRKLLVALDVGRCVCMLVLTVLAGAGGSQASLLAVVLAAYVLAAPYRPALTAGLPLVAGETELSTANARIGTLRQLMTFIGPLVGAAVVRWGSPEMAFAVNAGTFAIAALLVASVHSLSVTLAHEGQHTDIGRRAVDTTRSEWQRVFRTPGIVVVGALVLVMYAVRGSELVLYALAADERLGLGRSGIGVLTGAVGLGALAVMPWSGRIADSERPDVAFVVALLLNAVPIAALGWIRSPWIACVALVAVGAGVVVFEVLSVVVVLRLADGRLLGRVFGVMSSASNGGKLLGAMAAPVLVSAVEVRGALALSGAAVAAATVASIPALRSLTTRTSHRRAQLAPAVQVLSGLPLFDGASSAALQRLAGSIIEESCPAGTTLIRQGADADDLFVVRAGAFEAAVDGVVVNVLHPDDWFGEIGLLQHRPRTATVTALGDADVWRIPGHEFLAALGDMAALPTALLGEMAERLRRTGSDQA